MKTMFLLTQTINTNRRSVLFLLPLIMSLILTGCNTSVANTDYSATAQTIYTWRVTYDDRDPDRPDRIEKFDSTSLINLNGLQPAEAVTGPDEKGLWWPALPPRPTVDDIEDRQKNTFEFPSKPLLHKSVQYEVTYQFQGEQVTASTNHSVYRAVVKAHPGNRPLRFVTGIDKRSVLKAEPAKQRKDS